MPTRSSSVHLQSYDIDPLLLLNKIIPSSEVFARVFLVLSVVTEHE